MFSVHTSKRIDFPSLLLTHWHSTVGQLGYLCWIHAQVLHPSSSTWLKSGTSLLPFRDEKCNVTTKGMCRMAPPADPSVIQGLGPILSRPCLPKAVQMKPKRRILFLEYSDGFWEEFCSLLDMTKYLFSLQVLYQVVNNGF